MLDAKRDRLDYGAELKAPLGYDLDHAIATTYSLDLESILLIPIALFFAENLDAKPHEVRVDMLEALSKVTDHISIYCQRGKIAVPSKYNYLMAYWEKGVHQVQMPSHLQSFHPKIWIIRYTSDKKEAPVKYRFICTSRNLTYSRDWDLAFSTEGAVSQKKNPNNQGIIDLLQYLNRTGAEAIPKAFFKEIPLVPFDIPNNFNELIFHPIGIPRTEDKTIYSNPLLNSNRHLDTRLVLSPFLDDKSLRQHRSLTDHLLIFSSQFELSKLKEKTLNILNKKYMFSPFIEEAEKREELSEPKFESLSQSLHAKFYIDKLKSKISWFIGSANCTAPAFDRNVEFLIELKTTSSSLWPIQMEKQFTAENDSGLMLFEPFDLIDPIDESTMAAERIKKQAIRLLIHQLSELKIYGKVEKKEALEYNLIIRIPLSKTLSLMDGLSVRVRPLPETARKAVELDFTNPIEITCFDGYREIALSPYLVFEIWDQDELVKQFVLDMEIDLGDSRLKKIFSSIISNRSRFLKYLSFLLSDYSISILEEEEAMETKQSKLGNNNSTSNAFFEGTPIFEQLLLTASRKPGTLKSINKLIEDLKGELDENGNLIITKELEDLWMVFQEYLVSEK